ncbi:putative uncharacterized protein [Ruminococcus sp. CAG:579]|nr:putative uncharacterized protein [Ruminococcus sp. CAG:579]
MAGRGCGWQVAAAAALICTLSADRAVLKNIDWSLLLTFCGFFIFIGNVSAVPAFSGGLGTLIASMASLISYKQICREKPAEKGRYLACFTAANAVFLLAMAVLAIIL